MQAPGEVVGDCRGGLADEHEVQVAPRLQAVGVVDHAVAPHARPVPLHAPLDGVHAAPRCPQGLRTALGPMHAGPRHKRRPPLQVLAAHEQRAGLVELVLLHEAVHAVRPPPGGMPVKPAKGGLHSEALAAQEAQVARTAVLHGVLRNWGLWLGQEPELQLHEPLLLLQRQPITRRPGGSLRRGGRLPLLHQTNNITTCAGAGRRGAVSNADGRHAFKAADADRLLPPATLLTALLLALVEDFARVPRLAGTAGCLRADRLHGAAAALYATRSALAHRDGRCR
mmetsp:Transcript_113058/g.314670  ORF Transcript_113058/g.314670 Transcript_113058/m.314670 type:complete len:283 (+) Transcript_113058:447-1295(+)